LRPFSAFLFIIGQENLFLKNPGRIGTEIVEFGFESITRVHPRLFEHLFGTKPDISGIPVIVFVFLIAGGVGGKAVTLRKVKINLGDDPLQVLRSAGITRQSLGVFVSVDQDADLSPAVAAFVFIDRHLISLLFLNGKF
jgi:hypothetical protein